MLSPTPKACVDRALPGELLFEAMRRAVMENASNAPVISRRLLPPGVVPEVPRAYLAAVTGKLWQPGRTLRVRFLDGDPQVHARIPSFAHLWSEHADIVFDFQTSNAARVDDNAEIRISFRNQGSWSYIGTDALVIPPGQPTMNFGWFTRATSDEEVARVVIHEFGHALGCIHEHQNPAADIPWNRETVYAFYQGPPNFWNREQVDVNVFSRYAVDMTQFSVFDPDSIMLYPIPNEFTVGDFSVGWNTTLSPTDREFITTLYPATRARESELVLDAPPLDAFIGAFGAVDTFSFMLEQQRLVRIETEGETDVVMALFGPNDDTHPLAVDDDSGVGRNASLTVQLRPGRYTVRIRHFSAVRTGGYRIGLYRA
jgi:hypothetical protein